MTGFDIGEAVGLFYMYHSNIMYNRRQMSQLPLLYPIPSPHLQKRYELCSLALYLYHFKELYHVPRRLL